MPTNDVTIRLLSDVTNLKTGFSGAGTSVKQLSARIKELTGGTVALTKAGRFYDTESKRFISNADASARIASGLNKELRAQESAVRNVSNALSASVTEAERKAIADKSMARVSRETVAAWAASGNGVQQLTARLVALTNGQYILTQSGKILEAETGKVADTQEVAAAAAARLAQEQNNLRMAYDKATAGMSTGEKTVLNQQMAMTGMAHATGSASFAVISLGQVFQDMGQFGMGAAQGVRAITNNVQQSVQAFVMLSAMTGGAKKGLAALVSGLKGPAGFLAAFSLATGAIELVMNRLQRVRKEADDTAKKFNEMLVIIGEPSPDDNAIEVTAEDARAAVERATLEIERLKKVRADAYADFRQGLISRQVLDNELQNVKETNAQLERGVDLLQERLEKYENIKAMTDLLFQAEDEAAAREARRLEVLSELYAELRRDAADLGRANVELEDGALDLGEALDTWRSNFQKMLFDTKNTIGQLRSDLSALRTSEGMRLASMQLQTLELEKQVRWQQLLNRIRAGGKEPAGPGEVGLTPQFVGMDGVSNIVRDIFFSAQGMMGEDRTFDVFGIMGQTEMLARMNEYMELLIKNNKKFSEENEKTAEKVEKQNQRVADSFNRMGADMLLAAASFAAGGDAFSRSFGRFLSRWGKQLIQMGLAQAGFGKALAALKASIKTPGGAFAAIAAGFALAAIGRRLSASVGGASDPVGGGRGVGSFAAPNIFGSATNINDPVFLGAPYYTPNNMIQVEVQGRLRGGDIYISGQGEARSRSRMGVG